MLCQQRNAAYYNYKFCVRYAKKQIVSKREEGFRGAPNLKCHENNLIVAENKSNCPTEYIAVYQLILRRYNDVTDLGEQVFSITFLRRHQYFQQ